MGQFEVYEWLKNQREIGNESFFTPKEISEGVYGASESGKVRLPVWNDVVSLAVHGYLEFESKDKTGFNNFYKAYRIKKEYLGVR